MTALVLLLLAGLIVIGFSESRQGRWSGLSIAVLSAAGIVALTVVEKLGVLS